METPVFEIIRTLPDSFNSMIGQSINIDIDHAQELIGMLGEKLGIDDYRTNLATFWLLDTVALQVIRIKERMNSLNLGIVISWIAGEAKLIQDKQFSRVNFFREMGFIFANTYDHISKGNPLMYWEEITGIDSLVKQQEFEDVEEEEEEVASKSNSEREKVHSIDRNSSNSNEESSIDIFESIIESTYVVYANAFHYESVSAAFAKSIKIHSYRLPYTLRLPRAVQPPVLPSAKTETLHNEGLRGKARSKTDKGNTTANKSKAKNKSKSLAEIPPPPPSSMTDEEMIAHKRKQILPLMESNEAPRILEEFAQPPSINLVNETRLEKKGKRKI